MNQYCVILTTVPHSESGKALAQGLLQNSLAACINIIPGLESYYYWQGELQQDSELQLLIKSNHSKLEDIESYLKNHHPYELPELLVLPVQSGSSEYLNWMNKCLLNEK